MYTFIRGHLRFATVAFVVIEAFGVGYKIAITQNLFSKLPQEGSELILYTSFVVREQSQTLYGFISLDECDFFEALLNVTGIGPKTALSLIGHLPLDLLQKAILDEDIALIAKTPGIGKKGAERLIIEMRDKVKGMSSFAKAIDSIHLNDPHTKTVNDAISALINLGYNQAVAKKAINQSLKNLPKTIDVSELISSSLKHV